MPAPRQIVIASRESALAMWQARFVASALRDLHPGCDVAILPMTTRGDQILDRTLSKVGGKGLFVKELETALAEGRAGIAVHSMKDVPMELPPGFTIGAITARADPRDAFVSNRYPDLASLPAGAQVGTSSLRREAQLRARFPGLRIEPLRGNVPTRLAKLDRGEHDAIILAAAGLERLGLAARITARLAPEESLPAPGQGALGIECLQARADLIEAVRPLADDTTTAIVLAERTVSRLLGGSCQVPIGAYAEVESGALRLRAFVALPDGTRFARSEVRGAPADAERIGAAAVEALRAQGADAILTALGG